MKIFGFHFIVITIFLISGCLTKSNNNDTSKQNTVETALIALPLAEIDVPFETFSVNGSEEKTIITSTGAKIKIPANAFVDENQQPITGKVLVDYREIKSHAQIIASGVTMRYDSAGTEYIFQTAGMFQIEGTADGKQVFVDKNKQLTVDMLSYR